jgi:exonuclease III
MISILSHNIQGQNNALLLLTNYMKKHNIPIACVQEVSGRGIPEQYLRQCENEGYTIISHHPGTGEKGVGIIYKTNQTMMRHVRKVAGCEAIAMKAVVQGEEMTVVSARAPSGLDNVARDSPEEKKAETLYLQILQWKLDSQMSTDTFIVGGDLNETRTAEDRTWSESRSEKKEARLLGQFLADSELIDVGQPHSEAEQNRFFTFER